MTETEKKQKIIVEKLFISYNVTMFIGINCRRYHGKGF